MIYNNYLDIKNLTYCDDLLNDVEQEKILAEIDIRPWRTDLKRRVQHYGYVYDYKARQVDASMYLGELPEFTIPVAQKLIDNKLIDRMPDQVIVNEYEPGQGIAPHIDCIPCFDDSIVTISLGWAYEMDFVNIYTKDKASALLGKGSVLILEGEARYNWTHAIKSRASDRGIKRQRRVSLTFRKVLLEVK